MDWVVRVVAFLYARCPSIDNRRDQADDLFGESDAENNISDDFWTGLMLLDRKFSVGLGETPKLLVNDLLRLR